MKFLEWLDNLFTEPEPQGEPVTYEGKTYGPYREAEDEWHQWPNATCPLCGGLSLKRDLYFNKESGVFCHKACLLGEGPKSGKKK